MQQPSESRGTAKDWSDWLAPNSPIKRVLDECLQRIEQQDKEIERLKTRDLEARWLMTGNHAEQSEQLAEWIKRRALWLQESPLT